MLTANGIFALLHQKINIKINRFLFSIFLESPLNKGGSKWDSKIDGCTFMDNINNKQNNKRIAKNSILLSVRLIVTMCISLYTSRVVLNALGIEDYGIYNVVGGFVAIFSSLTDSLGRAFSRYMTVATTKDDIREEKLVFSATINILLVVSLLIYIICELLGTWYFSEVVNIPQSRQSVVGTVFQLSLISFLLTLCKIPFGTLIISHEKANAYAAFGILDALLKLGIVFFLSISKADKLISYCYLFTGVNLFGLIYTFIYCKYTFVGCAYIRNIPQKLYSEMFDFATWSFVGIAARIFNAQGIILIVNKFCGVVVNAALGIITQVEGCTRQFVSNIALAVNPQIVKSYATGNLDYMRQLVLFATKCFAFLVLYYAIPISVEADYLLKLWLGNVPDYTSNLLRFVFCSTLLIVMANPLEVSVQASGNIKRFQFYTSLLQILSVVVIWYMFYCGLNVYYVYAFNVFLYFLLLLVQFSCTKFITQIKPLEYVKNVLLRILLSAVVSSSVLVYISIHIEPSFGRLCLTCILSVVVTTVCALTLGFSRHETKMLTSLLYTLIRRKNEFVC